MMYLDSNVFIDAALKFDSKGQRCRELIKNIVLGNAKAASSTLTFDEIFWRVKKESTFDVALVTGKAFLEMRNLEMIAVDEAVLNNAYNLIKTQKLDPRDAIHAACAISHRIFTIISDDPDFDKIKELKRKEI